MIKKKKSEKPRAIVGEIDERNAWHFYGWAENISEEYKMFAYHINSIEILLIVGLPRKHFTFFTFTLTHGFKISMREREAFVRVYLIDSFLVHS